MNKLLLVATLWCASAPVLAQEAPARSDLFFGPSYIKTDQESLYGGALAFTRYVKGSFGIVLDLSGHVGSSGGFDLTELNLSAGPRYALNRKGSPSFFVQALFGLRRDSSTLKILDISISESESRFGMAAGAGADFRLSSRWALRVQGDYLYSKSAGETLDGFRVSAGAVYRFGAAAPKQP